MPSISLRDESGKIKPWVFILPVVVLAGVWLLTRNSGGGQVSPGQSDQLTGGLNDLTNGIIDLGNVVGTGNTPPAGGGGSGGSGGSGGGGSNGDGTGGDGSGSGGGDGSGGGSGDDGGSGGGTTTPPPPVTPPPDTHTNLGQLISARIHEIQAANPAGTRAGGVLGQLIPPAIQEVRQGYFGTSNIPPTIQSIPSTNPTTPNATQHTNEAVNAIPVPNPHKPAVVKGT